MTGLIQGNTVVFNIKKNDVYLPFACAKEVSINFEAEKISTKTVGSGYWKKYDYQSLSWTVNLSSLLKFDSNAFTGWDFLNNMLMFVQLDIELLFVNSSTGETKRMRGRVLVERDTIAATSTDFVTNELQLPGSGPLVISNPADDCNVAIISAQLVYFGGHRYIQINSHSGSIARYDYSIDGGGYVSHFPISYIPTLVLPDGLPTGDHDVNIIPYCANGNPGTPFDMTITIPAIYEIHGKILSGGATDPCGGALTPLYGTFTVGNVLYTDAALTTPITGYDYIIRGADIYGLDNATGEILADTGNNCSTTIKSNWYRLKTTTAGLCTHPLVRLYTTGAFGIGAVMYYDAAMTLLVTGATRIGSSARIYSIDFDTGTVLADISSPCTEGTPNDYILSTAASICDAPVVTYYSTAPMAVGIIVYTDAGVSTPLLGETEFADADTGIIYNMDDTTGEVLNPTGADCVPPYVSVDVKLSFDSSNVCAQTPVTKYTATGFAVGEILHNNILLNDPTSGYGYVVGPDGHIYNLDPLTGEIGTDTGVVCGTVTYDMVVTKEDSNDQVKIDVTDLSTSSTTGYFFNEFMGSKTFSNILTAGKTYVIEVNLSTNRNIVIKHGDGTTAATGSGTLSLTASGVFPETNGINIEITN